MCVRVWDVGGVNALSQGKCKGMANTRAKGQTIHGCRYCSVQQLGSTTSSFLSLIFLKLYINMGLNTYVTSRPNTQNYKY